MKMELSVLLASGTHGSNGRWRIPLHYSVSMPEGGHHTVAGADKDQLPRRGSYRCRRLQGGILCETSKHDRAHFIAQPIESAELIKNALTQRNALAS
jgi:hypothetical protein